MLEIICSLLASVISNTVNHMDNVAARAERTFVVNFTVYEDDLPGERRLFRADRCPEFVLLEPPCNSPKAFQHERRAFDFDHQKFQMHFYLDLANGFSKFWMSSVKRRIIAELKANPCLSWLSWWLILWWPWRVIPSWPVRAAGRAAMLPFIISKSLLAQEKSKVCRTCLCFTINTINNSQSVKRYRIKYFLTLFEVEKTLCLISILFIMMICDSIKHISVAEPKPSPPPHAHKKLVKETGNEEYISGAKITYSGRYSVQA